MFFILNQAKERVQALEVLDELVIPGTDKIDLRDVDAVAKRLKCPLSAKQYGFEEILAPLVAKACVSVCPKNPANFNVDNVRTIKIPGTLNECSSSCHYLALRFFFD
jgi:T-complex protein 1 subunit theta